MMKRVTIVVFTLLVMASGVFAVTSTPLPLEGGWSYARSGRANVSFTEWGHFNIANVGDIDVANYSSITLNYSNLSGRFRIATIGTVIVNEKNDPHTSIELSDEINSTTATSGSVSITFNTANYNNNIYKTTNTVIERIDLINQDEADASITIESVILTDNSDNTYEMGYSVAWSCTPTYLENKYTFRSWGQVGHDNWKTSLIDNTFHRFTVNFGDAVPAGFKFRIYTPDGEDEGEADDESFVNIEAGATSASVDINYTYKNIDLVNTSDSYQTVNISSVTRTIYTVNSLWSGTQTVTEWTNFQELRTDNKGALATAKIGDVIHVTCNNVASGYNLWLCNGHTYDVFREEAKASLSVQEGEQTFEYTPTVEDIERLHESGIVIVIENLTLTKVELISNDGNETLAYSPIKITAGVATYNSSYKLDFSDSDLEAYIASSYSVEDNTVTMTRIYKVPANTGLYLVGSNGDYEIPYYTGNDTESTDENLLHATDLWKSKVYESMENEYRYILASNNGAVGFYKVTSYSLTNTEKDGTYNGKKYHNLAAHKAYLQTTEDVAPSGAGLAPRVRLVFADENNTTAMENVENSEVVTKFFRDGQFFIQKNGVTYDVTGRIIK